MIPEEDLSGFALSWKGSTICNVIAGKNLYYVIVSYTQSTAFHFIQQTTGTAFNTSVALVIRPVALHLPRSVQCCRNALPTPTACVLLANWKSRVRTIQLPEETVAPAILGHASTLCSSTRRNVAPTFPVCSSLPLHRPPRSLIDTGPTPFFTDATIFLWFCTLCVAMRSTIRSHYTKCIEIIRLMDISLENVSMPLLLLVLTACQHLTSESIHLDHSQRRCNLQQGDPHSHGSHAQICS